MKTLLQTFSALMISAGLMTACSPSNTQQNATSEPSTPTIVEVKKVAITAIVEHPALNAVHQGVVDELAEQGFKDGEQVKINFQSAQGNSATAAQIAKQFVGDNSDVIVAIGTPSAQAVVAATNTIPVVFSAITDPVAAKLVPSWEPSGTNVTGLSDMLPLEPQIELMKKVVPNFKSVGYVYSPGEVNSTVVLEELQQKLGAENIKVEAVPAQRTTDIPQAAKSLKGKADLIYTSLDNNVVSAYESLFQAAKEIQIPLIASDTASVPRGAVAALGVDYYTLGRETGKMVIQILNGEQPGNIKPQKVQKLDLVLSAENAQATGLALTDALLAEAKEQAEKAASEAVAQ